MTPCGRCHGLYIQESAYDHANSGMLWVRLLRCVQCGDRVDPVILRHRLRQADERRLVAEFEAIAKAAPVTLAL